MRSIARQGLRANQAIGLFGHRDGVYASSFDDGELPARIYRGSTYALFDASHPCVVGDHMAPKTAVFPLDSGLHVAVCALMFFCVEEDGRYTVLSPTDGSKCGNLAVDEGGRLSPDFVYHSYQPEHSDITPSHLRRH